MGNFLSDSYTTPTPSRKLQTSEAVDLVDDLQIWVVNIDSIESVDDSAPAIMALTAEERTRVKRFMFADDQKRALLSILLQRAMVQAHFGVGREDYELRRSKEGKPYLYPLHPTLTPGTWNFNVSHHGKYVCIAAHSHLLIGADIVDVTPKPRPGQATPGAEFFSLFESQLTKGEMGTILAQRGGKAQLAMFHLFWSLKEAFIKAIGQGLGYVLQEVEFCVQFERGLTLGAALACPQECLRGSASVRVKGLLRDDWGMHFVCVDGQHVVSIAKGPLSDALPSSQPWNTVIAAGNSGGVGVGNSPARGTVGGEGGWFGGPGGPGQSGKTGRGGLGVGESGGWGEGLGGLGSSGADALRSMVQAPLPQAQVKTFADLFHIN
ncbi:hypothetical protein B484DRAFT_389829 [Ochromonadaceae sp. CCMP2298]|nr:hypothetical protein B484DRAFT_389829 [Ochromonadaceae sp. CCMP2298]